jgi:hypothetical protein
MAEEKEGKKGFRVVDKRVEAEAEEKKEKVKTETKTREKAPRKEAEAEESPPVPEVTFSAFVYSLSTSALVHLGDIPEPITDTPGKDQGEPHAGGRKPAQQLPL